MRILLESNNKINILYTRRVHTHTHTHPPAKPLHDVQRDALHKLLSGEKVDFSRFWLIK